MKIITYPDPLLAKFNLPLDITDPLLKDTIISQSQEMLDLMHKSEGVGLAAPQIGWNVQLFVFNETGDRKDDKIIINPNFGVDTDESNFIDMGEGCLSVPETHGKVKRWDKVILARYSSVDNGVFVNCSNKDFTGLAAHIIQHEMDHLNGILFIDKLNSAERAKNKRVIKLLERYGSKL